ncbi:flagellar protein FlaG [Povalibacter sp.]|uniref:flagellar protein FlaG n=1 Tax=Povalibacter sp. TaxID=1962978 RepID=UPI002F3F5706
MKADAAAAIATVVTTGATGHTGVVGAKVAQDVPVASVVGKLTQQPAPQDASSAVRAAAQQIDSYLKSIGREVEFRVDEESGTTVVTVRETATGDVIRQIPNEEVLQLARRFSAGAGTLLDLTV